MSNRIEQIEIKLRGPRHALVEALLQCAWALQSERAPDVPEGCHLSMWNLRDPKEGWITYHLLEDADEWID